MRNQTGASSPRWVLLGASGRLGRATLTRWRQSSLPAEIVPQARQPLAGHMQWSPLLERPPQASFDSMVFLAGAPTQPDLHPALAQAALRAARQWGVRRVLLASSVAVYGPGLALSEASPCAPVGDYGRAKLEMEQLAEERDLEVCCLRIGNVAGADALLGGDTEPVALDRFADGEGPRRSYIGPDTLADVLAALLAHEGPLPQTLNLAAPAPVTMSDLLRASGRRWDWRPAPEPAVQDVTVDCSQLEGLVALNEAMADPTRLVNEARNLQAA